MAKLECQKNSRGSYDGGQMEKACANFMTIRTLNFAYFV